VAASHTTGGNPLIAPSRFAILHGTLSLRAQPPPVFQHLQGGGGSSKQWAVAARQTVYS